MSNKYKIVAIIGASASGKDTVLNLIANNYPSLNKIVRTTTRPKRDYEQDGIDYRFVNGNEFGKMILEGDMCEGQEFNEWFYGTEYLALDEDAINIGVYNPEAVEMLSNDPNVSLLVFYIVCSDKTRLVRALMREDSPDIEEIFRRYKADKLDFAVMDFDYTPVVNTNSTSPQAITEKIREGIVQHDWTK